MPLRRRRAHLRMFASARHPTPAGPGRGRAKAVWGQAGAAAAPAAAAEPPTAAARADYLCRRRHRSAAAVGVRPAARQRAPPPAARRRCAGAALPRRARRRATGDLHGIWDSVSPCPHLHLPALIYSLIHPARTLPAPCPHLARTLPALP